MTTINTIQSPTAQRTSSISENRASSDESSPFSSLGFTQDSETDFSHSETTELNAIYEQQEFQNSLQADTLVRNESAPNKWLNLTPQTHSSNINRVDASVASAERDSVNGIQSIVLDTRIPTYLDSTEKNLTQAQFSLGTQPQSLTSLSNKLNNAELDTIQKQQTSPQLMQLNLQRSTPQLAQQNQLQSVVSELSNIELSTTSNNHSQALAPVKASQWGPIPVNTALAVSQQSQQLLQPLRDQVRFQIDHQVKQAEVRLDPPELGKLDMNVKLDGDRLQVQLHAATAQVRDALQAGIERLRSELALDHGGRVEVNISYGEQGSEQQQSEEFQIIAAAGEAQSEQQKQASSELDVRA